MIYSTLDSDRKIEEQCERWKSFPALAVDFEGEFNLHIYGEHLCLVQIFDGQGYWIIDPRAPGVTRKGLGTFFSLPVEKVWFDVQGDASLVQKAYSLSIEHVYDIRVLALLLGFTGTLSALEKEYLGVDNHINKKKNQTANWLKRPLSVENMEYALLDVKYLLELKETLLPIIRKEGLQKEAERARMAVVKTRPVRPGWENITNWKRTGRRERIYIRHIYTARDRIARSFNVPSSRVMDKRTIVSLAYDTPVERKELSRRLMSEPPRFRRMLEERVWLALKEAEKEEKGR